MPITTGDIFRSIEPTVVEHIGLGYAERPGIYDKIFKVENTDKSIEDIQEWGGLTVLGEKDEGDVFPEDRIYQGWSVRYQSRTFGALVAFTMEAIQDTRYTEIKKLSKAMGRAGRLTPEYQCALFIDRGFNSTYKVTGDRQSLFSTTHTTPRGGTYSNMLAQAAELSEEGLEQVLINLSLVPGTDDLLNALEGVNLVVPAQLGPRAEKLDKTKKSVGSNINDISYVAGKLNPIVDPYLSDQNHWIVTTNVTEEGDGLMYRYRMRPTTGRDQHTRTLDSLFYIYFRSHWGCPDARGVYGSNPS